MQALMRLPTLLRLALSLLRDARVPMWQKGSVVAALGLVMAPIDVVNYIPVVGPFWDFTLSVVIFETFINNAPATVVNEHIIALGLEKKFPLRRT
ncbi:MAG: hypothetical protein DLM70_07245 [Chloroflexi bacterium]|nr:MAG: hypothetical protein DLM70_07245 [Chloroflexota bacterium]